MAMKINRRNFIKGMAAGFAVAAMPSLIPVAERTEAATEILKAPGWNFIIQGGSGAVGDSMTLVPPGVSFLPDGGNMLLWPDPLNVGELMQSSGQIRLIPWRPYLAQFEHLIPEDVWGAYQRARMWRGR